MATAKKEAERQPTVIRNVSDKPRSRSVGELTARNKDNEDSKQHYIRADAGDGEYGTEDTHRDEEEREGRVELPFLQTVRNNISFGVEAIGIIVWNDG